MQLQTQFVIHTGEGVEQQLHVGETLAQEIEQLIGKLHTMLDEKEYVLREMESISAISQQSAATAQQVAASASEQRNEIDAVK